MSLFWVVLSIISAVAALLFEWRMVRREHSVHKALQQSLNGSRKVLQRFGRSLFISTIFLLLTSLALVGSHKTWETPLQGVAIVINTSVGADHQNLLDLEKGVTLELIRSLPGVSLSLYELKSGIASIVVPPTVDRLFFEIQLDGLLSSPHATIPPSLDSIQKTILDFPSSVPPWAVFVSSTPWSKNTDWFDGLTAIVVSDQSISGTIFEKGISFKEKTIGKMASHIIQRLNRSSTTTPPDTAETLLLAIASFASVLCCVFWRALIPPIATLGVCMAIPLTGLHATPESLANFTLQQAMEVSLAADIPEGEKIIESLLTTTTDPTARQRLLFDRALLAYLQGEDANALLWLGMEPAPKAEPVQARESLRGSALTRLFLSKLSSGEEQIQREELLSWLKNNPHVDPRILSAARLALISPQRASDEQIIQQTLAWLEEQGQGGDTQEITTAAALATSAVNIPVADRLKERWPPPISKRFVNDIQNNPSASLGSRRIWYSLSEVPTLHEVILVLLNQASDASNEALYFPNSAAIDRLSLSVSLLSEFSSLLPSDQRFIFQRFSPFSHESSIRQAATWYARAQLWEALRQSPSTLKPVTLVLGSEAAAQKSPLIRSTLASLVTGTISLPTSTPILADPLENALQRVLNAWYLQDPVNALDTVIPAARQDRQHWVPRLTRLLQQELSKRHFSENALPGRVAQGIERVGLEEDTVLIGRLWQIAIAPYKTPQDIARIIDQLIDLFTDIESHLGTTTPPIHSISLAYSIEPALLSELKEESLFQKNLMKRAVYDHLVQAWNTSCVEVQQQLSEPDAFSLPRVQGEVKKSLDILLQLRALFNENEVLPARQQKHNEGIQPNFSLQGEDSVRLFQEMDRSDRELQ